MIENSLHKRLNGIVALSIVIGLWLLLPAQAAETLDLVDRWAGDLPTDRLNLLPDGQRLTASGYIGDPPTFAAIWQAINPDAAVPPVDFAKNLVVFSRNVDFYNRISILKVTLTDGDAQIIAMQTMSANPIEDRVAMSLAVIPRAGIEYLLSGDNRIRVIAHR